MAFAMRWDEGSLRGTTRLKTLKSAAEKLGCADLFRRELRRPPTSPPAYAAGSPGGGRRKECLRRWAQPPRPPGGAGRYDCSSEGLRALQTSRRSGGAGWAFTRRGRNAFSPLFAPDNGGGPSGIGRGSAKTGRAPGSVTALAAGGRLSWHGGKGRAVSRAFPAEAGNGGILPQNGGVCNHENSRPCRGSGKKMSGPGKKRLTKARGYDMIILAA